MIDMQTKTQRLEAIFADINNELAANLKALSDDLEAKINELAVTKKQVKEIKNAILSIKDNSGPAAEKIQNKQRWAFSEYLELLYVSVNRETRDNYKKYVLDVFDESKDAETIKLILSGFLRLDQDVARIENEAKSKAKRQNELGQGEINSHGGPKGESHDNSTHADSEPMGKPLQPVSE